MRLDAKAPAAMATVTVIAMGLVVLAAMVSLSFLSSAAPPSFVLLANSVPVVPPNYPGGDMYVEVPSVQERRIESRPMWGYADGEEWGKDYEGWEVCDSGRSQSPINIKRAYWTAFWHSPWAEKYLAKDLHPFVWQVGGKEAEEKEPDEKTEQSVHFDGHKLYAPYKTFDIKAEWADGQRYHLEDMAFHTPSEHTVDGRHYPLEVQFIHRAWEQTEDGGNKKHELIVSVFFSHALESAHFVSALAEGVKQAAEEHDGDYDKLKLNLESKGVELHMHSEGFQQLAREVLMQVEMPLEIDGALNHEDNSKHPVKTYRARTHQFALPDATVPNYRAYWSYKGSRTEPPCTEDVQWVLLKHSLPVSPTDLHAISSLQGKNARKTQPLHHRLVHDSSA